MVNKVCVRFGLQLVCSLTIHLAQGEARSRPRGRLLVCCTASNSCPACCQHARRTRCAGSQRPQCGCCSCDTNSPEEYRGDNHWW